MAKQKNENGLKDSDYWLTPDWIVNKLTMFADQADILDPCADTNNNIKAGKTFTEKENGLLQSWISPFVFVNPPFSKTGAWIEKFIYENIEGNFQEGLMLTLAGAVNNKKVFASINCIDAFNFPCGRINFKPCLESHNTINSFDRDVVIMYVGDNVERFQEAFERFGRILVPFTLE